jgi:hypothetical protein
MNQIELGDVVYRKDVKRNGRDWKKVQVVCALVNLKVTKEVCAVLQETCASLVHVEEKNPKKRKIIVPIEEFYITLLFLYYQGSMGLAASGMVNARGGAVGYQHPSHTTAG